MSQRALQAGDPAPDFQLISTNQHDVRLYDILQHSQAVLFFFPKAFTPICTAEVCGFRDAFPRFYELGGALFGISSDPTDTAARFAHYYNLPYPLLVDEGGVIRRSFGVPKLFGVLPGRATYVIGQDRLIRHVTVAGLQSEIHVTESLSWLEAARTAK